MGRDLGSRLRKNLDFVKKIESVIVRLHVSLATLWRISNQPDVEPQHRLYFFPEPQGHGAFSGVGRLSAFLSDFCNCGLKP